MCWHHCMVRHVTSLAEHAKARQSTAKHGTVEAGKASQVRRGVQIERADLHKQSKDLCHQGC